MEIMSKCFHTLDKDPDLRYSDHRKVEKLLKAIKCQDTELLAAKSLIAQQYPRNFVAACSFFSTQVSRVHGPAQLEIKNARGKKRGIYAVDSRSQRGGRGRGRHGNRDGRGRSGHGGCGHTSTSHVINGIDISDPNRSFTAQEWDSLGHGRAIVMQLREHNQGRGRGRNAHGRGRGGGCGNEERNVAAVETNEQETPDDATRMNNRNDRGGRNGHGFGRGAYGGDRS